MFTSPGSACTCSCRGRPAGPPTDRGCPDVSRARPPGDAVRMLIVDAANVVGSRPTGWWRDRPGAARRFAEQMRAGVREERLEPPVILVLEGQARAGVDEGDADGV